MILVREVFQAKYGKGGELVALFKEARHNLAKDYPGRILTDRSGPFFTVVTETEMQSLAEWEHRVSEMFAMRDFPNWFAKMAPLVESGSREFYTVEG